MIDEKNIYMIFPKFGTLELSLNLEVFEKNMSEVENYATTWVQTPLSKFGFKCIMNKHNLCADSSCECLCHQS